MLMLEDSTSEVCGFPHYERCQHKPMGTFLAKLASQTTVSSQMTNLKVNVNASIIKQEQLKTRHAATVEDCWKRGKTLCLFLHFFPENVSWVSSFFRLGLYYFYIVWGDKIWIFQHILGILGFKFHNWGSRGLARKNTRLPHCFNGFPELLGSRLIIASSLSVDCAGVFLKFRWTLKECHLKHTPKESKGCSTERLLNTHMVFPLIKVNSAALARWLSGFECHPVHQKVAGSIPSQGACGRQPIDVSLCFSLSSKQNKTKAEQCMYQIKP